MNLVMTPFDIIVRERRKKVLPLATKVYPRGMTYPTIPPMLLFVCLFTHYYLLNTLYVPGIV